MQTRVSVWWRKLSRPNVDVWPFTPNETLVLFAAATLFLSMCVRDYLMRGGQ